eukprot:1001485-Rhodomonas_salina.1
MCFAQSVRGPFRGTNRAKAHVAGYNCIRNTFDQYPGTSGPGNNNIAITIPYEAPSQEFLRVGLV